MTFSLSCQEEPLATGVASTPALVLRWVAPAPGLVRRVIPVPGLVDPALLPAGDASLFGGVLNSSAPFLPPYIKTTLSHPGSQA